MSLEQILTGERARLYLGDSALLDLEPESVDALCCDPPAGISFMGREWDGDKGGRDEWIAWLASVLGRAYLALKPGAHALVWALPRTSHWTALAIEGAGFEIRDVVLHLFGSGFPKSLDVSKAIDERLGGERAVTGVGRAGANTMGHGGSGGLADGFGFRPDFDVRALPATPEAAQWAGWGTALKPSAERWLLCQKPYAKSAGDRFTSNQNDSGAGECASAPWIADARARLASLVESVATATCNSPAAGERFLSIAMSWSDCLADLYEAMSTCTTSMRSSLITDLKTWRSCISRITPESIIQGPTSRAGSTLLVDAAAQLFDGVRLRLHAIRILAAVESASLDGKASTRNGSPTDARDLRLEPGCSDYILARKPLIGTVAENVLRYGTGGLNIDGCRVGDEPMACTKSDGTIVSGNFSMAAPNTGRIDAGEKAGRWPAHVVLDEGAAAALDAQSGNRKAGAVPGSTARATREPDGWGMQGMAGDRTPLDAGGASRFFKVMEETLCLECATAAGATSSRASDGSDTAVAHAPIDATERSGSSLDTAQSDSSEPFTSATPSASRPSDASGTPPIRISDGRCSPASTHIATCPTGRATRAAPSEPIAITTTTADRARCDRCAARAISASTSRSPAHGDPGSVSRFLYTPKAPRSEKDEGLNHLPVVDAHEVTGRDADSAGQSHARAGMHGARRNVHPTVKGVALMRWLCRLVTPPGGLVLDLFAGSGTTGVAALAEGFRFVGVERDPTYAEIARGRLAHALQCVGEDVDRTPRPKPAPTRSAGPLFDWAQVNGGNE